MRICLLLAALLLLTTVPAVAGSFGPEVAVTAESTDGVALRVNVEAVNADIQTVLRRLAAVGQFNVVFADGAAGRVTVSLRDVRIDEAAAVIATSAGLGLVDLGDVRMVTPRKK